MLSTRVLTLLGRTASHVWRTAYSKSGTVVLRSSKSRMQTPIWSQTCSIGSMPVLRNGRSLTPTSCCTRKAAVQRALWGVALSWYTSSIQNRSSPREAYYRGESWCSTQHHQSTPTTMMDCTPYHNRGTMVTVRGLGACISQSLPSLQRTQSQPLQWNEVKRDASLRTQNLQCLRTNHLCVLPHSWRRRRWSSQSETTGVTSRPIASSHKPAYNAPNWQPPPKSAHHLNAQTRSRH